MSGRNLFITVITTRKVFSTVISGGNLFLTVITLILDKKYMVKSKEIR